MESRVIVFLLACITSLASSQTTAPAGNELEALRRENAALKALVKRQAAEIGQLEARLPVASASSRPLASQPAGPDSPDRKKLRFSYIKFKGKWMHIPIFNIPARDDKRTIDGYGVGHWGWVGAGAKVEQVIDDGNMLMSPMNENISIWLTGFSTAGLIDGCWMPKARIAIVGTTMYATAIGGTRTVLLAVPADTLRAGLSDEAVRELEEFLAMH